MRWAFAFYLMGNVLLSLDSGDAILSLNNADVMYHAHLNWCNIGPFVD